LAEQRLGQSEASLRHATGISERVAALRTAAAECGQFSGSLMQARGEMLARLDTARTGIAQSLMSLTEQRDQQHRLFVNARKNERIAEKLVEATEKLERQQQERRQHEVGLFRKTRNSSGLGA
jgi:hypothetical protein